MVFRGKRRRKNAPDSLPMFAFFLTEKDIGHMSMAIEKTGWHHVWLCSCGFDGFSRFLKDILESFLAGDFHTLLFSKKNNKVRLKR